MLEHPMPPELAATQKALRAEVIRRHVRSSDRYSNSVVCLSCGNAAQALRDVGLHVTELGPGPKADAALVDGDWWTPADVARRFPRAFDATSGHLSLPLMVQIAAQLRKRLGSDVPNARWRVPTGSGETFVCLSIAYPTATFIPVWDNRNPATTFDHRNPMNPVVESYCRRTGAQPVTIDPTIDPTEHPHGLVIPYVEW